MKVKEIIKALEKLPKNSEVYFDSEACCFHTHLVKITGVDYGSPYVTLHWNAAMQPHSHYGGHL